MIPVRIYALFVSFLFRPLQLTLSTVLRTAILALVSHPEVPEVDHSRPSSKAGRMTLRQTSLHSVVSWTPRTCSLRVTLLLTFLASAGQSGLVPSWSVNVRRRLSHSDNVGEHLHTVVGARAGVEFWLVFPAAGGCFVLH